MKKNHLRKGDQVVVITGNDRGKNGKVLGFKKDRVIVEGINLRKKHLRRTQENQQGQIIDIEGSVHLSNIMHAVDGKGVKLRVRENKKGERELYYKGEGKDHLYRSIKAKSK